MLFRFLGFFVLAWIVSVPCLYAGSCGCQGPGGSKYQTQPTQSYSDQQLTSTIQQKFNAQPWWRNNNLFFNVKGGKVVVRGTVSSFEEVDKIDQTLSGVRGVNWVENLVEIKTNDNATSRWNRRDFRR